MYFNCTYEGFPFNRLAKSILKVIYVIKDCKSENYHFFMFRHRQCNGLFPFTMQIYDFYCVVIY